MELGIFRGTIRKEKNKSRESLLSALKAKQRKNSSTIENKRKIFATTITNLYRSNFFEGVHTFFATTNSTFEKYNLKNQAKT